MEIRVGRDGARRKVVVTGGAGFIGSHLVDVLVDRGFDVHIIDNRVGGRRERINPGAEFHEDDVRDLRRIRPVIEGATYVFHLAALPRVQESIERPVETHDANVTGTLNVLVAALEGQVRRVVYSASSAAYGDQPVMPLTETMTANPRSPYGLHKCVGEQYCALFSAVYGLSTVSLRYFNVYGPRLDADGAYALVIGKFLKQRSEGRPLTITGDGTQTRDFTHVRDVVRANLLAAESDRVGHGEVINIGAGKNVSIRDVAALIGGPVEHIAPRLEPHDTLADTTRARRLLGWTPTVPFEDGLSELLTSAMSPSAA